MAKISNIDYQINEAIRDKEVRLVDENGEQLGIVKNDVAQRMAEERELDLVKIAPQMCIRDRRYLGKRRLQSRPSKHPMHKQQQGPFQRKGFFVHVYGNRRAAKVMT